MSQQPEPGGRSFEMTLEIGAPVDVVWKALTDADELMRWFPPHARVEPGAGGSIWLSWGSGIEGSTPITIWEPNRRLRTSSVRDVPWSPGEVEDAGPWEIAVDYFLEGRGGHTVLRLVHSGFGRGRGWDNELDSISSGWKYELRSLKHYLERHRGEDRSTVYELTSAKLPREEAWRLLAGRDGLCREGSIQGLAAGDRYRVKTSFGLQLAGTVLINNPPRSFAGTVEQLDDALVRLEVEPGDESSCGPCVWMSIWGEQHGRSAELATQWRGVLDRLFGRRSPYFRIQTAGQGAE